MVVLMVVLMEERKVGSMVDRMEGRKVDWMVVLMVDRMEERKVNWMEVLTVGSMGHASAIGMGLALAKPSRGVYCIDGDGALAMHMGNVFTVGSHRLVEFHPIQ